LGIVEFIELLMIDDGGLIAQSSIESSIHDGAISNESGNPQSGNPAMS
jgi:hypothetical protein